MEVEIAITLNSIVMLVLRAWVVMGLNFKFKLIIII